MKAIQRAYVLFFFLFTLLSCSQENKINTTFTQPDQPHLIRYIQGDNEMSKLSFFIPLNVKIENDTDKTIYLNDYYVGDRKSPMGIDSYYYSIKSFEDGVISSKEKNVELKSGEEKVLNLIYGYAHRIRKDSAVKMLENLKIYKSEENIRWLLSDKDKPINIQLLNLKKNKKKLYLHFTYNNGKERIYQSFNLDTFEKITYED